MKIEDLAGNYCIFPSDEEDFEMEICDTVEYENKTYAFMLSVDELDSEDVYIMQENVQKNSCEYYPVEDDKTLNILFEIFKERNRDWLIFDD